MDHYRERNRAAFLADSRSETQGWNYVSNGDVFGSSAQLLCEVIAPDRPADRFVRLRRAEFLAHQPVAGATVECERGLLQFGGAERQDGRTSLAANSFGVRK